MRKGGAFRHHNNAGGTEAVEERENAAEEGSRLSVSGFKREREGYARILLSAFQAFPCFIISTSPFFHFACLGSHLDFVFLAADSVSPCSLYYSAIHPDFLLFQSTFFFLTHGYLTASFLLLLSLCLCHHPSFFNPALIFLFLAPACYPSSSVGCCDACTRWAVGPRSQNAGLRSWRRGLSR